MAIEVPVQPGFYADFLVPLLTTNLVLHLTAGGAAESVPALFDFLLAAAFLNGLQLLWALPLSLIRPPTPSGRC